VYGRGIPSLLPLPWVLPRRGQGAGAIVWRWRLWRVGALRAAGCGAGREGHGSVVWVICRVGEVSGCVRLIGGSWLGLSVGHIVGLRWRWVFFTMIFSAGTEGGKHALRDGKRRNKQSHGGGKGCSGALGYGCKAQRRCCTCAMVEMDVRMCEHLGGIIWGRGGGSFFFLFHLRAVLSVLKARGESRGGMCQCQSLA
jgi:hypothetical protein